MNTSSKQKPEPVGNDWLQDFRRLFADEFPEPQCEAQKAVEGTSHQRIEVTLPVRFPRGEA